MNTPKAFNEEGRVVLNRDQSWFPRRVLAVWSKEQFAIGMSEE